jgi:hypothetical protein
MKRRTALALTGGTLTSALAGCLGGDSDDDTPDDAPEETSPEDTPTATPTETEAEQDDTPEPDDENSEAEPTATPDGTDDQGEGDQSQSEIPGQPAQTLNEYVAAVNEGDAESALALVHEDGNQGEEDVASDIRYFERRDITLLDRTIIEAGDGEVVVRGVLRVGEEGSPDANRIGLQMRLRRGDDDEWLIYEGRGYQLTDETETE